jgi:type I restriction enzyme S subunit
VKGVTTLDDFMKIEVAEKALKEVEVQGPYDLPKGWKWVKLKEILKEDRQSINPQEYPDKEFFLVTMDCIESNSGKLLKKVKCLGKEIKSMKYKFDTKHILYGKLRPYLNKVYVPEEEGICTTEFIPFIVTKALREYVAYYLRRKETVNFAMSHITGTRQPRVIINTFLEYPIPLPPLEEQKRIVSRLELLISRAEEAKRLRKLAKGEADKIMQGALNEVFCSAEEKGWKRVRLEEVAEIIMGQSPPSNTYNKIERGLPFYQGKVDFGEVYPSPRVWCTKPNRVAETGDILISVRAPVGPVNMCKEKSCIGRGLAAIRPNERILGFFLFYYLKSIEKNWIGRGSTFGAIRKSDLQCLQIPVPSLEEQEIILSYLDKLREYVESLKKLQQKTEEELEKLVPSILDKTFRRGI